MGRRVKENSPKGLLWVHGIYATDDAIPIIGAIMTATRSERQAIEKECKRNNANYCNNHRFLLVL